LYNFIGADCIQKFCKSLKENTTSLFYMYWSTPKYPIASTIHEQEGNCCACEKEINADDLDKYFNQFSGKYMGPIYKNCKPK